MYLSFIKSQPTQRVSTSRYLLTSLSIKAYFGLEMKIVDLSPLDSSYHYSV